ncbi:DUF2064 domain-containing protein [uncultured Formosa sp.]|uniref:TIGR04282 family arsenosugar biosynthesis glycosyltransferase n=1 Tax=uncultured Formosa sp. TaxID=255435 RepID=UPI00260FD640|nr:DUF2064 domain-containing protein [uncultured Formosa sp.]
MDCILFTEQQQQGETFGQRFTHAIASVFKMGYDNVITIGNDTPQLMPQHIKEAHLRLQQQQVTIGPSIDGGFYLLALSKHQFNAKVFEAFDWQTNKVFRQVHHNLTPSQQTSHEQHIHCLPAFYDLDQQSTIKKILAQLGTAYKSIMACLQALLTEKNTILQYLQNGLDTDFTSPFYNKGSPINTL